MHCLVFLSSGTGNTVIIRCKTQSVTKALRRNFERFQYYAVKVAARLSVNKNSLGVKYLYCDLLAAGPFDYKEFRC